jgi:hypothetical protein
VRKFGRTPQNIHFAGKTNLRTPHDRPVSGAVERPAVEGIPPVGALVLWCFGALVLGHQ